MYNSRMDNLGFLIHFCSVYEVNFKYVRPEGLIEYKMTRFRSHEHKGATFQKQWKLFMVI